MENSVRKLSAAIVMAMLGGCAGKVDYIRPNKEIAPVANVKVVNRARELVWNSVIPEIGKSYYVINNMDKSSGLINISYSGDPSKYIDCGRITSFVQNARGERTYDFAAASAQQTYEVLDTNIGLFSVDRRISLEGRVNLIFEEIAPDQTRVTVNTRYVVQRNSAWIPTGGGVTQSFSDSMAFNTGSSGLMGAGSSSLECIATGELEREVLLKVQ